MPHGKHLIVDVALGKISSMAPNAAAAAQEIAALTNK